MEQQHQQQEQRAEVVLSDTRSQNITTDEQAQSKGSVAPITAEAVDALLAQLDRDRQEEQQRTGWLTPWLKAFAGLCGVVCLYSLYTLWELSAHRVFPPFSPLWLIPPLFILSTVASVYLMPSRAQRQRSMQTLRDLAQSEDIRAIPPLASLAPYIRRNGIGIIKAKDARLFMQALTRLLPRLQVSDAGLVNARHQANLYGTVLHWEHRGEIAELQVAILKALGQIGDSKAIPDVARLVAMQARTREEAQVREAARYCLPFLMARAEQARIGQHLLRAASASDAPSDALLRPASSTPEAGSQQLLRASKIQDDEQA